jgi:hypothetical protein
MESMPQLSHFLTDTILRKTNGMPSPMRPLQETTQVLAFFVALGSVLLLVVMVVWQTFSTL